MSNFNETSKHFDPNIFPNNQYQQIVVKSKEDIIATIEKLPNGFFRNKNNNFQSSLPNIGLKVKRNNNSVLSERLDKHSYDLAFQRKADTKDDLGLIPEDRTCDKDEQSVIKYGLDHLPNLIQILLKQSNKVFSVITDKKAFNILVDTSSIPHILGLLNLNDARKNETRLYIEAVRQLEMLPNKSRKQIQKEYLNIIQSIILDNKEKILHTYANIDDYKKDLLGKISFKVCNLDCIINKITVNDVNNIEIFIARNNNNSYLLTIPLSDDDKKSYCCLVITKNDEFTYNLKSGGILTNKEYSELSSNKQFSEVWDKTDLSSINLLFKADHNTIKLVDELEEIRNKRIKRFIGSESYESKSGNQLNIISKEDKKIIAKQFNEMVIRNNSSVLNEIYNLLINSDKTIIKNELPILLIKLYQNYCDKDNPINDEDYYKTLLILSITFGTSDEINKLINACFSNDVNKISELIKSEDISCEYESSISISKTEDGFALNGSLNIKSHLLSINISNIEGKDFKTQIENINKQLEDVYKKIQELKINSIDDAKNYISLMNNYYTAYEIIQSSIVNLYSSYIPKNTTIDNIMILADNYPNIFNYLTELGFDKALANKKSIQQMIDEELNEKKKLKSIVDEVSNPTNNYTFDEIFDKLTKVNDNDALKIINIVSLKLLKDIMSQLPNSNYRQIMQGVIDKLNAVLEVKEYYSDKKVLEKVG